MGLSQAFAGPPAVVAQGLAPLGLLPELFRARLVPLLLGAPSAPEQLARR